MAHKNRTSQISATLERVYPKRPRMETSPRLQQLQGQTRGILGMIGLGALPLESHVLADMDLVLRSQLTSLKASYLVPKPAANHVLALAREDWPDSYLGKPLTPIEIFGVMVTLVPLFVVSK